MFGKFEGIGVESAWVWALQSSWVRVLKVRGKFEGVWAWKVRGKFEGVWAWKVHAESLRVRDWAWAGKMRGKFEGQGFESAWKVRGRGLRKVEE